MIDTTPKVIKVLIYNNAVNPIAIEKFEFPITEKALAKQTTLTVMNKMGKNSEAIARIGRQIHMFSHTAKRGPSSDLWRTEINYHPLAKDLE